MGVSGGHAYHMVSCSSICCSSWWVFACTVCAGDKKGLYSLRMMAVSSASRVSWSEITSHTVAVMLFMLFSLLCLSLQADEDLKVNMRRVQGERVIIGYPCNRGV